MATSQEQQTGSELLGTQMEAPAPPFEFYFEDYVPGQLGEYGAITAEQSEMIEFARRFDPQVYHTDPEKAASGPFQGVIASGLYTAGIMMRLFVDNHLSKAAALGSPGIDEMRWLEPVRPGDKLSIRVTILEVKPSRTKPDRGIVRHLTEVLNQHGNVVMTVKAMMMLLRRKAI